MRSNKFLLALFVSTSLLVTNTCAEEPRPTKRPKIGVVLEGGGAKGFAHVGVLKVLEEHRVPIDLIVGTSMGSIVAAAYASGRTIEEMEVALSTTEWDALFDETPPRQEVHHRQKAGRDRELFGDAKIGIKDQRLTIPSALVQGQNVEPVLQSLYGKVPSNIHFDDLPVPFRAVAADIETGETVVLDRGSLAHATRASMSVPSFFAPVELDGRLLVDGGITNNLPVDVALAMGAEIIIAVEFKDHLRTREQLAGPLAIPAQIVDMLFERTTQSALKLLRPQDVHVAIELKGYSASSFKDAANIMKLGEERARTMSSVFDRLAISEKEYREYLKRRTGATEYSPVIEYVRVEGTTSYHVAEIQTALSDQIDKPLNREQVVEGLTPIAQSGDFTKVTYDIEESNGKEGLVVKALPKEWLKNYARVGFSLEDNFDGESNYSLALQTRLNELNRAGGYTDIQLEAGRSPRAFVEFFQPIYNGSRFFIAPEASIFKQDLPIQNADSIAAELQRQENSFALKGGYSLGKYGELSAGWRRGEGWIEREIGTVEIEDRNYDIGEAFARLSLDQFDDPDFPTQGYRGGIIGTASRDSLGASDDFEKISAVISAPFTFDRVTLLLNVEAGFASSGLPAERYSSFGGFFDVSGFEQGSLVADEYIIYRTATYYRIAEGGSVFFPFGGFVGGTLEFASLRSHLEALDDRAHVFGGSIFVGANTPILPIYLGFGLSDESESSVYMTIGRLAGRRR